MINIRSQTYMAIKIDALETTEQGSISPQGVRARKAFGGQYRSLKAVYWDSAPYFASIIKERLKPGEYRIGDFGTHEGELLKRVLKLLPKYNLTSVGFDRPQHLKNNPATFKVGADLTQLPFADNSLHIAISRYTPHQNPPEAQEKMLEEFDRVTERFFIVQDVVAPADQTVKYKEALTRVYNHPDLPESRREGNSFSSGQEIEEMCAGKGINFVRLSEAYVGKFSSVIFKRYDIKGEKARLMLEVLGEMDYLTQITWVMGKRALS